MTRLRLTKLNTELNATGGSPTNSHSLYNVFDEKKEALPDSCNCCFVSEDKDIKGRLILNLLKVHLVEQIRIISRSDGKKFNENLYMYCLIIFIYSEASSQSCFKIKMIRLIIFKWLSSKFTKAFNRKRTVLTSLHIFL